MKKAFRALTTSVIIIQLVAVLCLFAEPVDARHKAQDAEEQPQQETAVASMAAPSDAPPGPGGLDKWHAPPVPNGWGFPDLNVRVANFAVEHLGQKVGNGECWTLAKEALVSAGAQPPASYVFGRELAYNEPWLPGDILQFTTCQFVEVVPGRRSTVTLGSPNHTAIVYSVANGLVTILQQNVNGDKHVQTQTLNFSNMVSGNVKVYSPVVAYGPRGGGGGVGIQVGPFSFGHHPHKKHKNDHPPTDP